MKGLIDSTLREGGQMVGVSFSLSAKKSILAQLIEIGIEELELGVATPYDGDLVELIRFCRSLTTHTRLALWAPCREENILCALALCPDVLSLSIPASDILIDKKLGQERGWVLERVKMGIRLAATGPFKTISLGLEDATRADPLFLQEVVRVAAQAGATRIRLADTVGIATPLEIVSLLRLVSTLFAGDIGVHMHNDFGMATANTIAALEAGADYADVTALGIGERTGNARLEEVAGFLALRKGLHYTTTAFKPLANHIATLTRKKIDPARPLLGDRIFHCESGLHLQGLKKDTATYEPYAPEKVGGERRLLYGAKIGKREIKECLDGLGIRLPFAQLDKLASEARRKIGQINRPLPQKEFTSLLTSLE